MKIAQRIDEAYRKKSEEKPRDYIGASSIGHPCTAYIAMNLRGMSNTPPTPRQKRIFADGHRIEEQVIDDLIDAGYRVHAFDPDTLEQWEYTAMGGHIKCHLDGKIEDASLPDTALLEIKSMNAASFAKFQKKGIKYSHREYYDQMQMCMGMADLDGAMIVAYCKDNSEYEGEIVLRDQDTIDFLEGRILGVMQEGHGERIASDEADWRCKMCFKRDVCWGSPEPQKICRTCTHSVPTHDGQWHCSLADKIAFEGCPSWTQWKPDPLE